MSDPIPFTDDPCDDWARAAGATVGRSRLRCQPYAAWVRSARDVSARGVGSRRAEPQAAADSAWAARTVVEGDL